MVLITEITPPEDGLMFKGENIKLKLGTKVIGNGTVYLTQDSLGWQPDNLPSGVIILWKQISVHGITTIPTKRIYFILDHKVHWTGVYDANEMSAENSHNIDNEAMEQQELINNDIDEGNETDEDEQDSNSDDYGAVGGYLEKQDITECWLIPEVKDEYSVDTIFRLMAECQSLHPDSADSITDESDFMDDFNAENYGDDEIILGRNINADAGAAGIAEAIAQDGLRNLTLNDEQRFADPEE